MGLHQRHVFLRYRLILCSLMAFMTGWVDVVCMTQYEAFATMMTGNLLYLGKTLAELKEGDWMLDVFHLAILGAYCVGLLLHQLLERKLARWAATVFVPLLATGITGVEMLISRDATHPMDSQRWIVVLLAPLFAVQSNTAIRGGLGAVTSMSTGHIHSLANFLSQAAMGELSRDNKKRLLISFCVVFSMILGSFISMVVILSSAEPSPVCSAHDSCAQLEGDCCPTEEGAYLGCCTRAISARLMLLPIAPISAFVLVVHDFLFWPREADLSSDEDVSEATSCVSDAELPDAIEPERSRSSPSGPTSLSRVSSMGSSGRGRGQASHRSLDAVACRRDPPVPEEPPEMMMAD